MPYKDIARRRACSRVSKKRARARLAHPLMRFKVYICPRFPFLRLRAGIQFDGGFFVSDDSEIQAQIERDPHFALHIFPLLIDTSPQTNKYFG